MMYKVEAIIREEKLEDIKEALHEIDVNGVHGLSSDGVRRPARL